ncbi:MAG: hypothetical protein WAU47_08550 [Desulfobaccales bacterium]
MNRNKNIIQSEGTEKATAPQDVKSLWERWDNAHKEETASDLVRGYNLLGVGLIISGSLLQTFSSSPLVRFRIAPLVIVIGAVIIAVKKIKALWLQRSLER